MTTTITLPDQEHSGDGADPGRPPGARAEPAEGGQPKRAGRGWFVTVWVIAFVLLAVHAPGQMTFDTKLGVDIDPVGFYARLVHLWNPLEGFGGLADQYIGYAFPMGAFYLLGHLVAVPVWLVERLWMSLLVAVGFFGFVRLGERLGIGSARTRLIAAAVFVLWPTYTILIGSTSAAVLPGLLAPWAVLPLASTRLSVRAAATRSGIAVLCMGGVNAVSTIAALTLPALFILTRTGRRRWTLLAWWIPAVLLATLWWLVPLLFQGRYGFDFLPYIEQAANTTGTTSASAVLRGSGNWVAYLHFGTAWLTAGWAAVASPLFIAASTVAAAVGLIGLARRDFPEARWLRMAAGIALLVLLAGYAGSFGGLFHGSVQSWLDGALAPFRNVYKFEPVLAVVLALGVAHVLARVRNPVRQAGVRRDSLRWGAVAVVAVALVGLALPYVDGAVLQPGPFSGIPSYWTQAANWLDQHSPTESAMVVPADSHATYTWGTPVDEPLEPLANSPWAQRELVPFTGAGEQAVMATAEQAIESGQQVPGLAAYLARAGVRYLLVRNDLDPTQLGYTPPQQVHETLQLSGFKRVATFGPLLTGGFIYPNTPLDVQALLSSYPAVEIFQADQPAPLSPVTVTPTSSTVLVNGGPDSLLQLDNQGLLGSQPTVLAGDTAGSAAPSAWAVTDGQRRQDTAFGLTQNNVSYTYTATETNPVDDPHGADGDPPRQLLPVSAAGHQTVAVLSGAASVSASSYGSWLWETPEFDPVNAFDGDASTAWTEGRPDSGVGQWLQIRFDHPVDLPATVPIQLLDDSAFRPLISSVKVTTDVGSATSTLSPTGAAQPLSLPIGATTTLRITITGVTGGVAGSGLGAGITEVGVPGVHVTRYLQPAESGANSGARSVAFSFHRDTVSPLTLATAQPETQLARDFSTPSTMNLPMTASAVAVPGSALDALVNSYRPTVSGGLTITASSTWGNLPNFRAANLLDGDFRTGWLAGAPNPTLHLSWQGDRSVNEIVLVPATGLATTPTTIRISSPAGTRELSVPGNGDVTFPALNTDQLTITFPGVASSSTYDPVVGQQEPLLVGLAELYIPALHDLEAPPANTDAPFSLPCGQGPPLTVDGTTFATSASGTVGDLVDFQPVTVHLCTPDGTLRLTAGQHQLLAAGSPGPLAITDLALGTLGNSGKTGTTGATGTTGTSTAARTVRVLNWQDESRQVSIGAGASSYLEVHEAFDTGWTATLHGQRLTPVQLDGWQQGFVVPAGSGGTVDLTFTPGSDYRLALAIAAGGVLVLAVVAVLPSRRRRGSSGPKHEATTRGRWVGFGVAVAAFALLFVIVGGLAAIIVPFVAVLGWLRPRWLPWLAGGAMVLAGGFTIIGLLQHGVTAGYGAFGAPAQVFALLAVGAALFPRLPGQASPTRAEQTTVVLPPVSPTGESS